MQRLDVPIRRVRGVAGTISGTGTAWRRLPVRGIPDDLSTPARSHGRRALAAIQPFDAYRER
jgi:hypothetical protein